MIVNEIAKFENPPMLATELLGVTERVQHAPVLVVVRLRFHLTSLRGLCRVTPARRFSDTGRSAHKSGR